MNNSGSLGPLELPEPDDMEHGKLMYEVHGQAMEAVLKRGLVPPVAPADGFRGELSGPLSSLDDNQLGDLLDKMGRYCEWVEEEYSNIQGMIEQSQGQLDFVKARVKVAIKVSQKGRITEGDKKDLVETNPQVIETRRTLLYYETMLKIIRPIKDGAQRKWDTVSRRITQRGQEVDRMRREGNVAGVPTHRSFKRPT